MIYDSKTYFSSAILIYVSSISSLSPLKLPHVLFCSFFFPIESEKKINILEPSYAPQQSNVLRRAYCYVILHGRPTFAMLKIIVNFRNTLRFLPYQFQALSMLNFLPYSFSAISVHSQHSYRTRDTSSFRQAESKAHIKFMYSPWTRKRRQNAKKCRSSIVDLPHVSVWLPLVISNVDNEESDDVTDGNDEEVIT